MLLQKLNKARPISTANKKKNSDCSESVNVRYEGQQLTYKAFKS